MTFASLFAGVGGFDLALERAGLECRWQVEIEPFPRRVLERHWPAARRYEDIRAIDTQALEPVDLLAGGWPCQDASVAGKRAGLAGERTGLFSEILRLVDGMAPRPRFLLLENVPGLVSVNGGRDFASCIHELRRRGYVGCVRRLDARHFGLAQRRQRLFFVAGLGAPGVRAVQLVLEGGDRYPAPRRETRSVVAALSASGVGTSGADDNQDQAGHLIQGAGVSRALNANGGSGRRDGESETFVTHALRAEGFDAREDGTGPGTPILALNAQSGGDVRLCVTEDRTPALQASQVCALYYSHDYNQDHIYDTRGPSPAHTANDSARSHQNLAGSVVRRLTPTECEMLQGFPVGWTCLCGRNEGRSHGDDPCRCADGPRYRALGNAVAVPPVAWLARRILEAAP